MHDIKFLELLIQCGAETTVRTSTQQMTALHVVLLQGKKTAEDTMQTAKLLMEHGLRWEKKNMIFCEFNCATRKYYKLAICILPHLDK